MLDTKEIWHKNNLPFYMQFFYENHTCLDKSKYLLCRTLYSTLVFPNISSSILIIVSIVFSMVLFSMVSKILYLLFHLNCDAWDIQEVAKEWGGEGGGSPPIFVESR